MEQAVQQLFDNAQRIVFLTGAGFQLPPGFRIFVLQMDCILRTGMRSII